MAFAIAVPVVSVAQCEFTLSGRVIDADTREPLGYSNIVIIETQIGAATDEQGHYVINNICAGTYTLRVSHLTCESKEFKIRINGSMERNFELPHRHNELLEICVVEEKQRETSTVAISELKGRSLEQVRGQSLAEGLATVPGITALKTGATIAKPVIHGLQGSRVLILNNGIRQQGQQWGNEHAPEIDPYIAKRITLIKGAGSVRYGSDAMAGVVLVEPDALPSTPGLGGEVNLAAFSSGRKGVVSATLEQNFKKLKALSWRLQGTLMRGGNIRTPRYYLDNTGYRESNFSAAAGWTKQRYGLEVFYSQFNSEIGIFSGSHIGNLTDLEAAFNRPEPLVQPGFTYRINRPRQQSDHELTKGNAWLLTGDVGKLTLTVARQYNLRREFDLHTSSTSEDPELSYEITSHTADLVWEHHNIGGLQGMAGLSGMYQANTFEGRMFIPNYENYTGGVFLIERWKRNRIQVEAGLRYDRNELTVYRRTGGEVVSLPHHYQQLSANAGLLYDITHHARFSFNAGSGFRPPGVNEMYSNGLHHGSASVEIGDMQLREEKSLNLIAGLNIHDHARYRVETAIYLSRFDDFIYLQPVLPPTLTIRGAFPTFRYMQTDVLLYGGDALGEYTLNRRWSIEATAALVRADKRNGEGYLPGMPADRFGLSLERKFYGWEKAGELFVAAKVDRVNRQTRVTTGTDYVSPPKGYTLVSLGAGTLLKIVLTQVRLTLTVNNLLNTRYRDYLNRYRYFADEEGRNIALKMTLVLP